MLLPTSAVLSLGLEKCENIAAASGGLIDTWKGDLGDSRVAIKAFRTCSAKNLKEAKEVSITPARKFHRSRELPDAVETSADMEEVIPPKHTNVPWRQHDLFSTLPRL